MDLRLFAAVVRRFRKIAIGGLIAALVLAGLAYMRGGGAPTWEAQAEVLITQANDPYGGPTPTVVQEGGYLGGLANVYAAMANGNTVQSMVRRAAGVPDGVVDAAEVVDPQTGDPEPLVTLTSTASSPSAALRLAERMPMVLERYITQQQNDANVPGSKRVQLAPIKNGFPPVMSSSKTKTVLPFLVFLGVLAAVLTLIFILENVNPKTAAALGRDTAATPGHAAGSGELATILAALVQNQHPMEAPSGPPTGGAAPDPADVAGAPKGYRGNGADTPRTRTMRDVEREATLPNAHPANGHTLRDSAPEPLDRDAAVMKRLLRGQS